MAAARSGASSLASSDRQPNGNHPAIDRPRMVHDPISLASLQRNEGTVAIGLGADIVWALALDRSGANDPLDGVIGRQLVDS